MSIVLLCCSGATKLAHMNAGHAPVNIISKHMFCQSLCPFAKIQEQLHLGDWIKLADEDPLLEELDGSKFTL